MCLRCYNPRYFVQWCCGLCLMSGNSWPISPKHLTHRLIHIYVDQRSLDWTDPHQEAFWSSRLQTDVKTSSLESVCNSMQPFSCVALSLCEWGVGGVLSWFAIPEVNFILRNYAHISNATCNDLLNRCCACREMTANELGFFKKENSCFLLEKQTLQEI